MPNLPSGTVTFVFSDIEGSTNLLKQLGDDAYTAVLGTHRRLVRETFAAYDGQEIDTQGDAFFYSFPRARSAVAAAVAVQRAHEQEAWPGGAPVRIRLGLHTGEPAVGDEGYTGLDVVRAARIAAVARGGQVLLSDTTRAIVAGDLPEDVELRSLGEQRLKDIDRPEPLHELRIPDVAVSAEPATAVVPAPGVVPVPQSPPVPPSPRSVPFFGDLVPPAGATKEEVTGWARGLKQQAQSFGDITRRTIEERVLAELAQDLDNGPDVGGSPSQRSRGSRRDRGAPPPPVPRSMAAEIERLQALRDGGALTDEQYAKAVDKAIEGRD